MKKIYRLALLLPLLFSSCSINRTTEKQEVPNEDNKRLVKPLEAATEETEDEEGSKAPTLDGYTSISVDESTKLFEKGKTFTNYNEIHFVQKGNDRDDDIKYKRYENLYTIQGSMDSSLDAWDPFVASGVVGFPKDGSIDRFYDVLRADPYTEHARCYTVKNTADSSGLKKDELTYPDAEKKLNDYENNFTHFVEDTYDLLRTDSEYCDFDSIKAGTLADGENKKLRVIASKEMTFLGQDYVLYYQIDGTVMKNGAFSDIGFVQTYSLSKNVISSQKLEIKYGEYFHNDTLLDSFDPEPYFVQDISEVSFDDIWIKKDRENTIAVGSEIELQPYYKGLIGATMFKYAPDTAVDEYDMHFTSSSDEEVLMPLSGDKEFHFKAMKPGKATLTISSDFNPYIHKEIEVNVRYAEADKIFFNYPYNSTLDHVTGYLNSETVVTPSVNPYCALQSYSVVSDNPDIFTVRKNVDGQIVIKGIKTGTGTLTVKTDALDINGKPVTRSLNVTIEEELKAENVVGVYKCDNLWDFYGIKFRYEFSSDRSGTFSITGKGYTGDETVSIDFHYSLDYATQDVIIVPDNGSITSTLKKLHMYSSDFLYTTVVYGDYTLSVNLMKE